MEKENKSTIVSAPNDTKAAFTDKEIRNMKAKLRGMDLILMQNAALEREVERLCAELDDATLGIQKKGYLYKWREREIFYASKWGLRYVVLQGNTLSYFADEQDTRPRRSFDLSNCYVRDEGKKKGGYHVFSVYLSHSSAVAANDDDDDEDEGGGDNEDDGHDSLLIRLSTESSAEAALWINMLEKGCAMSDESFPPESPMPSFGRVDERYAQPEQLRQQQVIGGESSLANLPDDAEATSPEFKHAVAAFLQQQAETTLQCPRPVGANAAPLSFQSNDDYGVWGHSKFIESKSGADQPDYDDPDQQRHSDSVGFNLSRECSPAPGTSGTSYGSLLSAPTNNAGDANIGDTSDGDGELDLPPVMLQRVHSTSRVLRKSQSRSAIAKQILAGRMPAQFRPPTPAAALPPTPPRCPSSIPSGAKGADGSCDDVSEASEWARGASPVQSNKSFSGRQVPATSASTALESSATRGMLRQRRAIIPSSAPTDRGSGGKRKTGGSGGSGGGKTGGHKRFPAYKNMHVQAQSSPLSNDTDTRVHNFRGFFNLGIIILVLSHLDLVVNNISRYGLKVSLPMMLWESAPVQSIKVEIAQSAPFVSYICLAMFTWVGSILLAFSVETAAYWGRYPERLVFAVNVLMATANIVVPTVLVWYSKAHPGLNMVYLFQSAVIWMKLISYAHVNKDLRVLHCRMKRLDRSTSRPTLGTGGSGGSGSNSSSRNDLSLMPPPVMLPLSRSPSHDSEHFRDSNAKPSYPASAGDPVQAMLSEMRDLQPPFLLYPMNLTLYNLLYFTVAPTLCYQLNYPRTPSVRWSHVASLVLRMLVVAGIMLFSVEQYIRPTLETSLMPMQTMNVPAIVERLLKLSIPNTYIWLLGFYLYFHLWLNLLAELTRFGDRQFYKEWWNARTIEQYWRNWNLPVHHWCIRHLYYPLLRMKTPKFLATLIVFFFSAFMHELVISVPFRYIAMHAFAGMLAQVPMISLTKYIDRRFDNPFIGNAIFWCMFCVFGQPMGIIMYHYDLWKVSTVSAVADTILSATAETAAG